MSEKVGLDELIFHEAGHAVAALAVGSGVEVVGIVATGQMFGICRPASLIEDAWSAMVFLSAGYVAEGLATALAGREQLREHDEGTDLASLMASQGLLGKSAPLLSPDVTRGMLSLVVQEDLDHDLKQARIRAREVGVESEAGFKELWTLAQSTARSLLLENRAALDRIARALVKHGTLTGGKLETILRGEA